ncbi:MAG: hypothetical protein LBP87_09710 [Planctomycetaceae bacterium]|jgi:hypothetical protein|nr:hypothetical protein [Planctomycetaceae bacterium]
MCYRFFIGLFFVSGLWLFQCPAQTQPTQSSGITAGVTGGVTAFTPPELGASKPLQPLTHAPATANPTVNQTTNQTGNQPTNNTITPSGRQIRSKDSILGDRIAKITTDLEKIPKSHDQIWREYDITPYTKGRNFPETAQPEQTIVDWILRQTGIKTWHSLPFGILTADSEKLYVYHTKEVQLAVADIVDRFVNPQFFNESCTIRIISLSRPDWIAKGHQYLRPMWIASPGIQGWILEREGAQALLQELAHRTDFKEIAPPQFLIPNGIAHNVVSKKQRTYLRDVQINSATLNGYVEDRVTIEEGFNVSFVPLSFLDGLDIAATIKLDIVQIEKMIPLMIDAPTATNPRQRIQIEAPQVACFKLDEMIRWPKNKILLLDLGTIPLPNSSEQAEPQNFFSGLAKNIISSGRANVLLFIECVANNNVAIPVLPNNVSRNGTALSPLANGQIIPARSVPNRSGSAIGANSSYWQGVR